ncbi:MULTISPECIES: hypothetical protein [Colwellia]|jgi:uncharacterized membrane protein (DUF485 family)|uniref:Uncharacterized protein n=1 Tax=Colwellia psychrerythraea (strain 34H / ATCC BAA-681) TaxID=167879 RepID=Q47Y40_COLP3|nr:MULTISPECIES: hypothetical protein [Colwellia]AAZ24912.1 hypothetical protein CPS_3612 [Colwellia psychrerythraea 34H]PKH86751.1 hypothetical protein CXF79_08360 [Colwellia sp. Bg11-28]
MIPPNKHLLALINYFALVPLVYFIPTWISPYLPDNKLLHVCIVVGIIVPIISYIVMPITMKILVRTKTEKRGVKSYIAT